MYTSTMIFISLVLSCSFAFAAKDCDRNTQSFTQNISDMVKNPKFLKETTSRGYKYTKLDVDDKFNAVGTVSLRDAQNEPIRSTATIIDDGSGNRRFALISAHTIFKSGRLRAPLSEVDLRFTLENMGNDESKMFEAKISYIICGSTSPRSNPSKDWCMVQLNTPAPKGFKPIIYKQNPTESDLSGELKLVAYDSGVESGNYRAITSKCKAIQDWEDDGILHNCDTNRDASGSLLLNSKNEAIAFHQAGMKKVVNGTKYESYYGRAYSMSRFSGKGEFEMEVDPDTGYFVSN